MSPTGPNKHRFTIHFDVSEDVFHILSGIGKAHQQTPNDVARNIILAWMTEVESKVVSKEDKKISETE